MTLKDAIPKFMLGKYRSVASANEMLTPLPELEKKGVSRRNILRNATVGGAGTVLGSSTLLATVNDGRAATGKPIPVGCGFPFTGWGAHDAAEFKNGAELAAEEINAMGGILGRPIEIHIEDTKNQSADEVVSAFGRLIDRKQVHALICGYNTGTNCAEYETVADAGILYLNHNTKIQHHEVIERDPARYFGIFMSDPAEYWYGAGYIHFISWLRDTGQWKPRNNKLGLISGALPYSIVIVNAMKDTAQKNGWEVAFPPEIVATPTSEWGPPLAKIRAADVAAFANTHFPSQEIAQCQNQFMNDPIDALPYYQFGAISSVFTDIARQNALGVTTATVIGLLQDEIGMEFDKKYRKKYGAESTPLVGCETYASMHHWAMAAALAGGTGEPGNLEQNRKVAARLKSLVYRSVCGTMNMHPKWQAAIPYPSVTKDPSLGMPHLFFQVQEVSAARALIAPEPYSTGKFMLPPWFKNTGGLPKIKG
jgi:branched-chain amino acid transport system substrate-binding protein